jgi:hypothetical protein
MRPILFILMIFILANTSCRQSDKKSQSKGNMMLQDSTYANDKDVKLVRTNDTIRLVESKIRFEDNPNIMQTDIDAAGKVPDPGIQYVKAGDTLRIREPKTRNR